MVTFEPGCRISEALALPAGAVADDPDHPSRLVVLPEGGAVKYGSFHTLRRTRITEVAATDFTPAMTMAGHANPATTAAYVDRAAHGTLDLGGIRRTGSTR